MRGEELRRKQEDATANDGSDSEELTDSEAEDGDEDGGEDAEDGSGGEAEDGGRKSDRAQLTRAVGGDFALRSARSAPIEAVASAARKFIPSTRKTPPYVSSQSFPRMLNEQRLASARSQASAPSAWNVF